MLSHSSHGSQTRTNSHASTTHTYTHTHPQLVAHLCVKFEGSLNLEMHMFQVQQNLFTQAILRLKNRVLERAFGSDFEDAYLG
jgi:hypothetical protein